MDKEKAYNGNYKAYTELINRLEDVKEAIKKQNYGIAMDILYKPYPEFQITASTELAESEDERIRKAIIAVIHLYYGEPLEDEAKEMIAWLEKQGNNMGISEATKQKLEDNLNKALEKETPESCNEFLEKQGEQKPYGQREECLDCQFNYAGECKGLCAMKRNEQKPADKTESKFKVGDRVIGIVSGMPYFITEVCDYHYNTESGCIIMFYAQDNFELYEQKHAWSEKDEEILNLIIARLHSHPNVEAEEYGKDYHWLKSLKDRVQLK